MLGGSCIAIPPWEKSYRIVRWRHHPPISEYLRRVPLSEMNNDQVNCHFVSSGQSRIDRRQCPRSSQEERACGCCCCNHSSASMAAWQPAPAAVIACLDNDESNEDRVRGERGGWPISLISHITTSEHPRQIGLSRQAAGGCLNVPLRIQAHLQRQLSVRNGSASGPYARELSFS
jgi:hypothetical protein